MASGYLASFQWKGLEKSALFFTFTWQTIDVDACKKCLAMNGTQWQTLELTPVLVHPLFGDVYDLEIDKSLVHPNCRCYLQIDVQVDLEKIPTVANFSEEIAGVMKVMPSDIKQVLTDLDTLDNKVLKLDLTSRQLLRAMNRLIILLERSGLDKDTSRKAQEIQRVIMLMRELLMSVAFLQMGTPYGWAMGLLGIGLAATSGLETQSR